MLERATWPLRLLFWKIEERVIWPIGDALHRGPRPTRYRIHPAAPESEPAADAGAAPLEAAVSQAAAAEAAPSQAAAAAEPSRARIRSPLKGRLGGAVRDVSVVLATLAVAVGAGIGIATLVNPSESPQGTAAPAASAPDAAAPLQPASSAGAQANEPSTLEGVAPDFESSSNTAASESSSSAAAQPSPTENTNSKPSSIPPGVANVAAAMDTARDFAGAFVLYEVGKSDAKVQKTFARTATPALARALRDRPPRLPEGVDVPTAKVQNVVLGAERGREVDASVSLLRLGDLSELRLTLTRRHGTWAVSEVRG